MIKLNEFREIARAKFRVPGKFSTMCNNPIEFLYSLDWYVNNGSAFSENEISVFNMDFDQNGCFGRSVKAAVLAEQFFPGAELFLGEVYDDFLRSLLVNEATDENWKDKTYLEEILQYENPHTVIIFKDKQFDPIFKSFPVDPNSISHPKVGKLPLWEGLYCSYLVSESLLAKKRSIKESFEVILIALTICPEMILLKENLIGIYGLLYEFDKAVEFAKVVKKAKKEIEKYKR